MKKILVTGASGFLGYHILPLLKDKYQVDAIYYRQKYDLSAVKWHKINLLDQKDLIHKLQFLKPDAIIHAAAISSPNLCEEHIAFSHHVNVYASVSVAEFCKSSNIPLIFISSDLVFNGAEGNYRESDFCFPLSQYGVQKLEVEEFLAHENMNSLICRLSLLFGHGPSYTKNFLGECLKKLKDKEDIIAFTDEFRTPLSANWAAKGIILALEYLMNQNAENKEGTFHLGGNETISRFNLARLIANVFDFDDKYIVPKLRTDFPMSAPRPENVSLDSSLASDILNFNPPSLSEQLSEIKKLFKNVQ